MVHDAQPVEGPEVSDTVVGATGSKKVVGGKPWVYVDRVSQPTMTVYSPAGSNTGVAVVVFSGGGYNILAIDLEGTEVCDLLTSKGITCVLLKYRVPCVTPFGIDSIRVRVTTGDINDHPREERPFGCYCSRVAG